MPPSATSAICRPAIGSIMPRLLCPLFATSNNPLVAGLSADCAHMQPERSATAGRVKTDGNGRIRKLQSALWLRGSFEAIIISYAFTAISRPLGCLESSSTDLSVPNRCCILCSADVSSPMLAELSGPQCRHAPAARPVGSRVHRLPVDYALPAKTSLRTQQA